MSHVERSSVRSAASLVRLLVVEINEVVDRVDVVKLQIHEHLEYRQRQISEAPKDENTSLTTTSCTRARVSTK